MHAKESRRTSNTGRFATLALQNAEVRLHGLKDRAPPVDGFDDGSTFVLFPGRGARPLTPEYAASLARPLTLVVPDGNWTQTKHMMHRVPLLASLPKVELPGPTLDLNRARRNVFSDRMSTFEAIAQALGTLEDQGVEEELLGFMRQAVDRMLMLRGKLSKKDVFGGLTAPGPLL